MNKNPWLVLGAIANFAIALLHLVIIVIGPVGYAYFGAADLGELAAQGSSLPAIITSCLVFIFCVFGFYALSGAGFVPRLPLLTLGLIGIGSIYTLRGLVVIFDLIRLMRGVDYPFRQTVFSGAALGIGVIILIGVVLRQRTRTATQK